MYLNKQEYKKNIYLGIYEVLDLAGYDLKDADEIVERIKGFLDGYEFSDKDLLNSHYAHVVILLGAVNEWEIVEDKLDKLIKEVLDKAYLDREARIIENEIIKELVQNFNKDKKAATELVKAEDIRKQIDGYSLLLHFSAMDWALCILTKNKDLEVVEQYLN